MFVAGTNMVLVLLCHDLNHYDLCSSAPSKPGFDMLFIYLLIRTHFIS